MVSAEILVGIVVITVNCHYKNYESWLLLYQKQLFVVVVAMAIIYYDCYL